MVDCLMATDAILPSRLRPLTKGQGLVTGLALPCRLLSIIRNVARNAGRRSLAFMGEVNRVGTFAAATS
jgi:hypothetical protein